MGYALKVCVVLVLLVAAFDVNNTFLIGKRGKNA